MRYAAADLHRPEAIEPLQVGRAADRLRLDQGAERHHRAIVASHIQDPQVADIAAKRRIRLHDDFEGPTEAVEIIDLHPAQERLQRAEYRTDRHAEFQGFFPVDFEVVGGRVGPEGRVNHGDFRAFAGFRHERLGNLVQILNASAALILQHEAEAAEAADTGQRRHVEGHRRRFRNMAGHSHDLPGDRIHALRGPIAVGPVRQLDKQHGGVGLAGVGQQIDPGDRHDIAHIRQLPDFRRHRVPDLFGPLQAGRFR